jgi:hypothetical protein
MEYAADHCPLTRAFAAPDSIASRIELELGLSLSNIRPSWLSMRMMLANNDFTASGSSEPKPRKSMSRVSR